MAGLHRADKVWAAILGAGVAFEVFALRNDVDSAFSRRTRVLFHTDTAAGRWLFITAWTGLYAWFLRHILRGP